MKTAGLLFALMVCSLKGWGQPTIEWVRELELGDYDNVWDLIQSENAYVFACSREIRPQQPNDTLGFWIIGKLDVNGTILWQHEYQSSGRNLRLLARDGGGYSIAGSWTIIVNFNEAGDSVSSANYLPFPINGVGAWSLAASSDNEWLFWADPNINEGHFLVSKVSPQGNIRWEVPYSYSNVYYAGIFGMESAGGATVAYGVSQGNYALDHIDSNGNPQWSLDLDARGLTYGDTRLLPNEQLLVINAYLMVTMLSPNGEIVWNHNYGDGEYRSKSRSDIAPSGQSVFGVSDPEAPDFHNRIFVTSSIGDSLWSFQLPDSLRGHIEWCRFVDGNAVIVGVNRRDDGSDGVVRIIKIAGPTLGVAPSKNVVPEALILRASPNPFNPTTTISFSLPKNEHVRLVAYDLTGRAVATLVDERIEQGNHTRVFDGANLPSGIFFARLTAGQQTITQKMLLVK